MGLVWFGYYSLSSKQFVSDQSHYWQVFLYYYCYYSFWALLYNCITSLFLFLNDQMFIYW